MYLNWLLFNWCNWHIDMCTLKKRVSESNQKLWVTFSFWILPLPVIGKNNKHQATAIDLCTCYLRRKYLVCPAQCPAAARSWKTWELWDVQSHRFNPTCFPCFLLCSQASSPESSAGTSGNLCPMQCPMQCPCCTPASALPHSRKSSRPSSDPGMAAGSKHGKYEGWCYCTAEDWSRVTKRLWSLKTRIWTRAAFQNRRGQTTCFCFTSCIHL